MFGLSVLFRLCNYFAIPKFGNAHFKCTSNLLYQITTIRYPVILNKMIIRNCKRFRLPSVYRMTHTGTTFDKMDQFELDFHKNHVQISPLQRGLLSVGSAVISLVNPHRADMIACLGETGGTSALMYMKEQMEQSPEGLEILRSRPRINSKTVDLEKLKKFPEDTLGKTYVNFLEYNKVTPDSRLSVQFIDDIDVAYVLQRYREAHDLFHTILGMPTNMLGEVTVKWVEAIQTKLPMCIGAAIFGPIRLKPKHRQLYLKFYLPWAKETAQNSKFLLNTFFEKRWEQPMSELLQELNIKPFALPSSSK